MDHISEALEALRSGFPFAMFTFVPVLLIIVSPIAVDAAHDFKVYRMQQYDIQGSAHGCRSALVNAEARTLQSSLIARKCVMIKSSQLTYARYLEVADQGPSAILIIMQSNMSAEQTQNVIDFEMELSNFQTNIPIYFAEEDEELKEIYDRVTQSTRSDSGSALAALADSATSVGYQLVATTSQSKPMNDHAIINIEGVLSGLGIEDQLPTIAIVAHYDSYGIAPYLSYGMNSDASGVVALLELSRLFGKFYNNARTHPKHNVVFLLSGGGKFNYQGSRKWLEDGLDNTGGAFTEQTSALLSNTKLVVCLEGLASSDTNSLRMHVSKPPNPGTAAHTVHSNLIKFGKMVDPGIDTSLVHKKIRLASDLLAWEHERFSIRRLHAVTLSSIDSYDNQMRRSMMDTKEKVSVDKLSRNIGLIAESVLRYLYNVSEDEQLDLAAGDYAVHKDRVQAWMGFLASYPRPVQALTDNHPVVTALELALQKNLKTKVHKTSFKADKRDPEFLFYDALTLTMSASIVRPAVFDLYVALAVLMYVGAIYVLILKFNGIVQIAKKVNSMTKIKVH